MDIDLSVLRSLEAEKDISMDLAIKAIEDALLVAYHRTDGAAATARVEVNRGSGHVTVWAAETADDGAVTREYDEPRRLRSCLLVVDQRDRQALRAAERGALADEAGLHVDRDLLFGQVADVAHRGANVETIPQEPLQSPRLGGGLDDDQAFRQSSSFIPISGLLFHPAGSGRRILRPSFTPAQ